MNKNKHKYDGNVNTTNVLAARRYKIYEATLKSLNNLFQNLQKEITTNFECIHQISIVLGGSPVTAKEVYDVYRKSCSYLNISNSKNNKRYLFNKILSSLMKSPQLQNNVKKTLPVNKTNILIKTSVDKFESVEEFLPKDNFKIPMN
ncbi:uncharacterized protein LOC113381903 [Ctenocephalides felis]|uniref:uncharacterized protein LOC113381903 n=1 Tax=Ctenocephalides felis TaxID=7515 RepID=UPI000E6E44A7|nr:uncharacterized protein LOC113381903 [Ctenocephalides felis]